MADSKNGQGSSIEDNGLYSYDSFSGGKRTEDQSNFLWWCAGAHQRLLKQFPSEQIKYSGLGGVLLATLVLACLSAGYAVYTVFNNTLWAVAFAIVWGLI